MSPPSSKLSSMDELASCCPLHDCFLSVHHWNYQVPLCHPRHGWWSYFGPAPSSLALNGRWVFPKADLQKLVKLCSRELMAMSCMILRCVQLLSHRVGSLSQFDEVSWVHSRCSTHICGMDGPWFKQPCS